MAVGTKDVEPEPLTEKDGEEGLVAEEDLGPSTDLVVIEDAEIVQHDRGALTLFGTDDPAEIIVRATKIADALADVIRKQKLAVTISGREYVRVEGWTFLGTMLGVFPVTEWTRPVEGGWEARVEARTKDGSVVGAAEAECLRSEKTWKTRDDYALRSMAATRATSKALRLPLGFVMTLAGFEATPADEMTDTSKAKTEAKTEPVEEAKVEKATPAEIDGLRGELKMLEGVAGWSEPQVLTAASKSFKRQIEKLADLRSSEVASILAAAQKARAS